MFALFATHGAVTIFAQLSECFFLNRINEDQAFHIMKGNCN